MPSNHVPRGHSKHRAGRQNEKPGPAEDLEMDLSNNSMSAGSHGDMTVKSPVNATNRRDSVQVLPPSEPHQTADKPLRAPRQEQLRHMPFRLALRAEALGGMDIPSTKDNNTSTLPIRKRRRTIANLSDEDQPSSQRPIHNSVARREVDHVKLRELAHETLDDYLNYGSETTRLADSKTTDGVPPMSPALRWALGNASSENARLVLRTQAFLEARFYGLIG